MTRLDRLKATKPHVAEARIFPMHYAPIVLQDGDRRVMRLGRYHCRKPGEAEFIDRKLPGLYNARRDSLGKYWQGLFGVSHAVMMVESFFENVERDGKNQVLHFIPRPAEHHAHRVPGRHLAGPEGRAAVVVIRGDHR